MTTLTDARLFVRGCDLSGQSNEIEWAASRDAKDATTFRSGGWAEQAAGLAKADIKAGGFAEFGGAGTVDFDAWARLGQVDAWTIGPGEASAGALAYLTKALRAKYAVGGKVGDLCPWSSEFASAWPMVRGVFLTGPASAIAHDGNSTAVQLGALSAGQRLYASLHVVSVTGAAPTLDVTISSDSVEGFGGSPETRLTFAQATGATGEILRTEAGVHADTWYRATWNASEVGDESFLIAVAVGIF